MPLSADLPNVLVVDLDDTLLRTDTLFEQAARLAFQSPLKLVGALAALTHGIVALKSYLAGAVTLDPALLPLNEGVRTLILDKKAVGWKIVLCTAADYSIARSVADHLGLFDDVIATDGTTNLKAGAKAARLVQEFPDGFVYAGDSAADLAVWREASGMVLVGTSPSLMQQAKALGKPVVAQIDVGAQTLASRLRMWVKALRLHHASKNVLLFLPLLLAHEWANGAMILKAVAGFVLLIAIASASYLINDLSDLDADRRHWTKRDRPLASGTLPIRVALPVALLAIPLALVLALLLAWQFALALLAYLVITLAYSFGLKRIPMLDTFIIGILFTMRLVMGMTLLQQPLSEWLVGFSLFFFYSLASAKRYVEIVGTKQEDTGSLAARGYVVEDAVLTLAFGVSSGMASLIIMMLYLVEDAFRKVTYHTPFFLWIIPLVLAVWIGRIWYLAHHGRMDDDPVAFALKDRVSIGLGFVVLLGFALAL